MVKGVRVNVDNEGVGVPAHKVLKTQSVSQPKKTEQRNALGCPGLEAAGDAGRLKRDAGTIVQRAAPEGCCPNRGTSSHPRATNSRRKLDCTNSTGP